MEDQTWLQSLRQTPKPNLPAQISSKLLAIALPIPQVVIGALYLQKCPVQPKIPVYLVVSGAFGLMLAACWLCISSLKLYGRVRCLPSTEKSESEGRAASTKFATWTRTLSAIVTLFLFCWFIAGNVWIYSIYEPNYNPLLPQYCDKTLYLFAFWTVTLVYIFIGFLAVIRCVIACCNFLQEIFCDPSTDQV